MQIHILNFCKQLIEKRGSFSPKTYVVLDNMIN